MRRLSRTILLLLLLTAGVAPAMPQVTLITIGPGDEVWEKFGHNMLRVQDADSGFDACYNWGLFDFDQPGFIGNFVKGRMVYWMAALDTAQSLDLYRQQNRQVTFQKLILTPQQTMDLIRRCETNRLQANKYYRYDYFKDNCSTRVRDMIDAATGGALAKLAKGAAVPGGPVTFRRQTTRLMQDDFWISLGTDFAMGPDGDRPLDAWANGFLPEQVALSATPLAEPATQPWPSTRPPEHAAAPHRSPWLFLTGLATGGLILGASAWRAWAGKVVVGLWWTIAGLGGAFMTFMWAFTDHVAAHANQNLWHFSPLALAVPPLLIFRFRRSAAVTAVAIVAVSVLGTVLKGYGILTQHNVGFILLALPANLAAARALTTPTPPDELGRHAQNPVDPDRGIPDVRGGRLQ